MVAAAVDPLTATGSSVLTSREKQTKVFLDAVACVSLILERCQVGPRSVAWERQAAAK